MKQFTVTYTNDENGTNLSLTTTDVELIVDVINQLIDDTELVVEEEIETEHPLSYPNPAASNNPEAISLRRWMHDNYKKVSKMDVVKLFKTTQYELVREGKVRRTCSLASVKTYHAQIQKISSGGFSV
tara:strand:- start:9562 stop:9945 length:384 start_codon:yes stop_codon:yes gene_type:complete